MTRKSRADSAGAAGSQAREATSERARPKRSIGRWAVQDAKARFSELIRRVKADGPQLVTVHGHEAVVVLSAEEFRRLRGEATGQALIDALQASPHRDSDVEPGRAAAPVRHISL